MPRGDEPARQNLAWTGICHGARVVTPGVENLIEGLRRMVGNRDGPGRGNRAHIASKDVLARYSAGSSTHHRDNAGSQCSNSTDCSQTLSQIVPLKPGWGSERCTCTEGHGRNASTFFLVNWVATYGKPPFSQPAGAVSARQGSDEIRWADALELREERRRVLGEGSIGEVIGQAARRYS